MTNLEGVNSPREFCGAACAWLCGLWAPVGTIATGWALSLYLASDGTTAMLWWALAAALLATTGILPVLRIDWVNMPRRGGAYLGLLGLAVYFLAAHLTMMGWDPARLDGSVYLGALLITVVVAGLTASSFLGRRSTFDERFTPSFMARIICQERSAGSDGGRRPVGKRELEQRFTREAVRLLGEAQLLFCIFLVMRFCSVLDLTVEWFLSVVLVVVILAVRRWLVKRADQRLLDQIVREAERSRSECADDNPSPEAN